MSRQIFNLGGSKSLVNQVALFHSETAVMPPIRFKSLLLQINHKLLVKPELLDISNRGRYRWYFWL